MSDNERQNVINLFKNNVKGYMAINDIQEIITCITYLFWNSKYVVKEKFNGKFNNEDEKKIYNTDVVKRVFAVFLFIKNKFM